MTLRKDNKTGTPGIAWDTRRGAYQVRVNNRSRGYYENFDLAKAVHKLVTDWPQGLDRDLANEWSKP